MGCNAWNHPSDCPCDFRGGHGGGGSRNGSTSSAKPFQSVQSYVNPNAHCPECGAKVFFYQSPYGGRVFFNRLGWPWPKHGCTDNPRAQKAELKLIGSSSSAPFRNAKGEPLTLYKLVWIASADGLLDMTFSLLDVRRVFHVSIPTSELEAAEITIADLKSAPSFVVRTYEMYRVLEFISARKQTIDSFRVDRQLPKAG